MTKPRTLVRYDRVVITGGWNSEASDNHGGERHIGKFATVLRVDPLGEPMPIQINIDGIEFDSFHWDRETLRALPRK